MSVPGGFSNKGLPIGIQLQGPHFREDTLLKVAISLEKGLGEPPGYAIVKNDASGAGRLNWRFSQSFRYGDAVNGMYVDPLPLATSVFY